MKCYINNTAKELFKLVVITFFSLITVGCKATSSSSKISGLSPPMQENDTIMVVLQNLVQTVKEKTVDTKVFEPDIPIVPGDVLEVKFFYTPELNELQTVRPDGKISLQLLGEVDVWGKIPSEVKSDLLRLYTPYLKNPEVTVLVRLMYNRRIFVGGEVMRPGLLDMPAKMTVLEAIMLAGGFNLNKAETENVLVIRRAEGQQYSYSVDLKPALRGYKTVPFFLEPEDIVYVPETRITEVDRWVDQHLTSIIPSTGFLFLTPVGNSTVGIDTSSRRSR